MRIRQFRILTWSCGRDETFLDFLTLIFTIAALTNSNLENDNENKGVQSMVCPT